MERTADVVVIGGGIVGCMCTYELSRKGLRVVLVERDGIAGATSGSCMGHLMVVQQPAPMYHLTRESVRLWVEHAEAVGSFDYNPTGALWLAESDDDAELLSGLARTFAEYGDSGQLLDRRELRELEPGLAPDLAGGFFYPPDGVVMPMKAAGAVLRAALNNGAEVWTHAPVRGVRRGPGGRVEGVETARGAISTPAVVNSAGVWAPWITEWAGLGRAPIYPRRGDLAITMPRECPVAHQLLEVGYLRTTGSGAVSPESGEPDPGATAINIQPQTHGTCLVGSTRQFGGYERVVNEALLARSLERAIRFVPEIAGARLTRAWAGLRPYTIDKLPIIGPVSSAPGFFMAAGHEGLGITLAPITARLVAESLTGSATSLPLEPFSMDRFAAGVAAHG